MGQKIVTALGKLIGQNWRYKDYSNWMNESGNEYPFKASRNCLRCKMVKIQYQELNELPFLALLKNVLK